MRPGELACDQCDELITDPSMGVIQWNVEAPPMGGVDRVYRLSLVHKGQCAECNGQPFGSMPWIELASLSDPRDAIATLCSLLAYRWEREHLERLIRIAGALSPEGAEALRRVG